MKYTPLLLLFLLPFGIFAQYESDVSHLKGMRYVYMDIDTTGTSKVSQTEKVDLSDIVELQLRRADIEIRPFVVNEPERNVPLLLVKVNTDQRSQSGQFELVLEIRDFVTINRNKKEAVATTFSFSRSASISGVGNEVDLMKTELRELMSEFTVTFREQNP
ncbi:MAG: hypothetical protein AAF065_02210 [Verrucomicrobiota bacterium]